MEKAKKATVAKKEGATIGEEEKMGTKNEKVRTNPTN